MKIVIEGCLCESNNDKDQLCDAFRKEFDTEIDIIGYYLTLPGHGGEGGRSDIVVDIPDNIMSKAAIHPWHLNGLFRWYDDYIVSNRDIVPEWAIEKFFEEDNGKIKEYES